MKKTFKTMLALMVGAMVFTACSNDDITENIPEQKTSALKPMTFYASMEGQDGATRAAIDGLDIKWVDGDKISIFDGSEENNGDQEFTLTSEGGSTSGIFEGDAAEASTYYALYPYMASSRVDKVPTEEEAKAAAGSYDWCLEYWKDDIIYMGEEYVINDMGSDGISKENQAIILAYLKNQPRTIKSGVQHNGNQFEDVILPAVQTVTEGQYVDPKALLMLAQSDDVNSLQFKNVCAYVKVTPQFDCTTIRLTSKGTESLAGTVTLDYNGGTPTANVTANGVSKVTLTGTIKGGNAYYIAVSPATLNSGFTIRFITTDAIYEKSTTKVLALTRNNVINLGSFATSDLNLVPITGTATRTGGTNVNWVQLWANGPKFAEYNVGATSKTEYGGYYAWGGTYANGEGITANKTYNTGTSVLTGNDDTATALWGSNWRMPTSAELQALLNNCDVQGINVGGVNGRVFTGRDEYKNNSVFLPATGYCDLGYPGGVSVSNLGSDGRYWSSTPSGDSAYDLEFDGSRLFGRWRDWGFSVRPVLAE